MAEEFELEPGLLKPEARLLEELELDSLDGVDFVVALEKQFQCRINEDMARKMQTLKQVYDYICTAKGIS
jgi:acyl carrier protein